MRVYCRASCYNLTMIFIQPNSPTTIYRRG